MLEGHPASGKDPRMSDPSPLVFELCTAIGRFYERDPDLSVSDVLAALDEVSMALAYKRARTHWSPANVVRISDYKRGI
jgi:hypothetical protein